MPDAVAAPAAAPATSRCRWPAAADVGLEERRRRHQEGRAQRALPHVAPAGNPDRLGSDHDGARPIVNVDEEAIGTIGRLQEAPNRRPQGFVVAGHHQHRDGFALVCGRADNHVSQQTRVHAPLRELAAERQGDAIAAGGCEPGIPAIGTIRFDPAAKCPMTMPRPSREAPKTNATLERKPDSAGEGIGGATRRPSSVSRRACFAASCAA